MKNIKRFAALLMALACCTAFAGCGDNNSSKSDSSAADTALDESEDTSDTEAENETGEDASEDKTDEDTSEDKTDEDTSEAETDEDASEDKTDEDTSEAETDDTGTSGDAEADTTAAVSGGEVGEVITPDPDSQEAELGEYRLSPSGVKFYYGDPDIPDELMLALEKYFNTFAEEDYSGYLECIYPGYADEMESYLQSEYEYGLEESFKSQCENLRDNMGGSFTITRIRAERNYSGDDTQSAVKDYFSMYDSLFGKDYYAEVSAENDDFEYLTFFVIAQDESGEELMLISAFDIVFVNDDGVYYTFG